ncbi:dihydroorotase [Halococcoides cellulosivorans]|uniref:Dihydroorotase n=1 Tax=Halococcoides cellulosivorans TaxID=1679096 RepID=A0A2R4WY96_9EURY|nr:dihydroorotase [Halococcoides cellulosivorans]AWB26515.1 dihydroorotase [Halococcoides cellulosivorans]
MLITDARLADGRRVDVRVRDGSIAAVDADIAPDADERTLDAAGRTLLPGVIDPHVHFREPGADHKETWTSGSRSAAAGGVTTVIDQPNTDPPTVDADAFDAKAERAQASLVDYGLAGGVTAEWEPDTLFDRPIAALGEVFLADSTGDMGIDEGLFRAALDRAAREDVLVTVHAEDATLFDEHARDRSDADAWSAYRTPEAESRAVERAVELAADVGADLHVAHTSTPEAIDIVADSAATCEVSPHHCLLSRADLPDLGTHGRMNPPLRSESRRQAVFERVRDGRVDLIATDHAPHTRAEKDAGIWAAPSGVPGVETALPLLLGLVAEDEIALERVVDLTARRPADRFGLAAKGAIEVGRDADLTLVDLDATGEIRAADLHTACEWTPFGGWTGVRPEWTMVRGEVVYEREGDRFGDPVGENAWA